MCGSSDDYNHYAKITNNPGWSWNKIQSYFCKVRSTPPLLNMSLCAQNECWSAPADHHNTMESSTHLYTGFMASTLLVSRGLVYPFDHHMIQATPELPDEFPFNIDTNSGHQIGIGALKI